MRHSTLNRRPRELATLCATCRRAASASQPNTRRTFVSRFSTGTSAARNEAATREDLTRSQSRASGLSLAAASTQKRWLSRAPASLRAATAEAMSSQPSSSEDRGHRESRSASDAGHSSPPSAHKPPPSLPFYALFPDTLPDGPPPAGPFAIDTRALRREFLRLQAASHPDFHHAAASASSSSSSSRPDYSPARAAAEAVSAHINEAYRTLSSPLLRAQYLLRAAHGVDLAGDESGANSGAAEPDVLLAALEAREDIEAADSEKDLLPLTEENDARIAGCEDALAAAFAEGDVEAATREAVRLRYWVNVRESISNWERGKEVVLQH